VNRHLVKDEAVTFQISFLVCTAHYAHTSRQIEVQIGPWHGNRFILHLDPNLNLAEIQEVTAGHIQGMFREALDDIAVYQRDARTRRLAGGASVKPDRPVV
jgi:hypothetical protein